jgi:hypothetical protein
MSTCQAATKNENVSSQISLIERACINFSLKKKNKKASSIIFYDIDEYFQINI